MSSYVFSVTSPNDYESTISRVTEALKQEGFGVLTTIDVAATLQAKLGIERKPYIILGACNPGLAHQALEAEPDIGALLPCNVVVRTEPDDTVSVVFMDPVSVLGVVTQADVHELAQQVHEKMTRVAQAVQSK